MGLKRGGFIARAQPLVSKSPLKADPSKPLARTRGLNRTGLARGVPAQRKATPQQARRREQLATWADVRKAALERDDYTCVGCGKPAESVHHRAGKGAGGSKLLDVVENAISLCGRDNASGCHQVAHRYKNTQAAARGLSVPRGADYASWPVEYCAALGGGMWLLNADGGRVAA